MDGQRAAMHDGFAAGAGILAAGGEALLRSQQRLNLLAEAGRLLGSALDYEATLSDVCRLVVPTFADWCVLDLVAADGALQRLGSRTRTRRGLSWRARSSADIRPAPTGGDQGQRAEGVRRPSPRGAAGHHRRLKRPTSE
jgi:hypothetical protein